jgi:glucokinase
MTWLVGDIGGTNSRLAFADAAGLHPEGAFRHANADFAAPEALLRAAIGTRPAPEAICLAVAGPVIGGAARLTNRDWMIDPAAIMAATGARRVVLLNDLAALGQAAARLPPGACPPILDAAAGDAADPAAGVDARGGAGALRSGQGLVIGIGTGLNACVFVRNADAISVLEAEAGHASLPSSVLAHLSACLPAGAAPEAAQAPSCEALLAGDGLAHFARQRGLAAPDGARGVAERAATGDRQARAVVADFAALMGLLARELALFYLPRLGVWMAGSVARGVLSVGSARDAFMRAYGRPVPAVAGLQQTAVARLITDDAAALEGCRLVLAAMGRQTPP